MLNILCVTYGILKPPQKTDIVGRCKCGTVPVVYLLNLHSFMAQLTLARFRGDTSFGWVARVMSTFLGGIMGMVMW